MEAKVAGALGLPVRPVRGAEKPWCPAAAGRLRGGGPSDPERVRYKRRRIPNLVGISCCNNSTGHENLFSSIDEADLLKMQRRSQDVLLNSDERCIYLVGMMGSGKSTVGKVLADILGYSFQDSDKLVEQAVGIPSVAQIFKVYSEAFFRDNETKALKELSTMRRLVVATGGGAVIRPINWKYMKHGLSIWLDVPLEALARRIAKVGTDSRPLLSREAGDPYTKAFLNLSTLAEQRFEYYTNADVRVSLEEMAAERGISDVCMLTPTDIALEALIKMDTYLTVQMMSGPQVTQAKA